MDQAPTLRAEGSAPPTNRGPLAGGLLLLGLFAWQACMTLGLFGDEAPLERLLDDQPILSGRHPLHLYHGYLGAQALRQAGSSCCYDPAFQIGYPKTPVFDSGSRPAELFLGLAGGGYSPAAYKVGLALCCLLVPWLLAIACRGAGLGPAGTFLGTAAGLVVWWSGLGRQNLEAGDLDLYLAALASVAHAGLLLQFDRAASLRCWLGLLLTGSLTWFAHPLLALVLSPLFLVYYLTVGCRHRQLPWHLALLACQAGALGANAFWLADWVSYWWIRSPFRHSTVTLQHRTLHTVWDSPVWGDSADRAMAVLLLGSGMVGLSLFQLNRQRAAVRVLGLGAGALWLLAVLGITWERLGSIGTHGLMVPALWFAAIPAAHAWVQGFRLLTHLSGTVWRAALLTVIVLAAAGFGVRPLVQAVVENCVATPPLVIGLGPERSRLVDTLSKYTTPQARILWEDRTFPRETPRWTVLVPLLSRRPLIGGLDPEADIEYAGIGLVDGTLAGESLSSWTDAALDDYCRSYNVGWIVCWTPSSLTRLRAWPGARQTALLTDTGSGALFTVLRQPSFVLKGKAVLVHADSHHLTLTDVVPDKDGRVVLSFHYQAGMRASPSRVQIEREINREDPIAFIRLKLSGPVACVTLTWEDR
jgi:hypothetical protein